MERRSGHFQDIRELGAFIVSIWGAVAALSIGLPLLNNWIGFLPPHPTLTSIPTAVAVAAALFAFLYAYVEGEEEGAFAEDPTGYRRRAPAPATPSPRTAFGRFAWAIFALTLYLTLLALYAFVRETREFAPGLIGAALVPVLLVTYAATFGFLTAALGSLAMVHQLSAQRNRLRPIIQPLPEEAPLPDYLFAQRDDDTTRLAPDLQVDRAR